MKGWRFLLLNVAAGAANVVMLSNVPGYTVLAPYAAGSLEGVTPSYGTWATTDHMVGIALSLPLSRWLSGRLGAYRVLIGALVTYAAVSLMCAASETIWFFAPMRFLLGLIGGIALPLAQSVTLAQYPDDQRTLGVGFWAEYFNWRWLFYSNVLVALPVAGVVAALFYGSGFERRVTRFDTIGFILLATVLLGVQTILNMGNDFDWCRAQPGGAAHPSAGRDPGAQRRLSIRRDDVDLAGGRDLARLPQLRVQEAPPDAHAAFGRGTDEAAVRVLQIVA
jgi:DHA2 family multidrug resistance protein